MQIVDKVELDLHFLLAEISEIQMFGYLSEDEKKKVLNIAEVVAYDKKEKIIIEGAEDSYLYAVLQGTVHVMKKKHDKEVHISSLSRSDVFGEAAIFVKTKRTADVVAGDSVQVFRFERKEFLRFLKANSDSGIKVLMVMVYGLLKKLKEAHSDLSFDRQLSVNHEEIESILKEYNK